MPKMDHKPIEFDFSALRGKTLSEAERAKHAVLLATQLLEEANKIETSKEKGWHALFARMLTDPLGKAFTLSLTDQCFRSHDPARIMDQIVYLQKTLGIPSYLPLYQRIALHILGGIGPFLPSLTVPLVQAMIRKESARVVIPAEATELRKHLVQRQKEGVHVNLNYLGEAILGEEEATRRLQFYLDALTRPEVECVSIKISTICSQLNLLAFEHSLEILSDRLRQLYRVARDSSFTQLDGTTVSKVVHLDMEEYRDLHLTVELFQRVLDEPEFHHYSAGIVLQSYLPDSYELQQQLTRWALNRTSQGRAPIKLRLVKGANLAMEKVDASSHLWPQAPYLTKQEVDANFKRMLLFGCEPKHARAVHLGVASHNLFDIAYAMILRVEKEIEPWIGFEMLEGMAQAMQRVVQKTAGSLLLYCPAAHYDEFQTAVAYLARRFDENTGPENFLRHLFGLRPGTDVWDDQAARFLLSCQEAFSVQTESRRQQDRFLTPTDPPLHSSFSNEPDTDWAVPHNRKWAQSIREKWLHRNESIPVVIGGKSLFEESQTVEGQDPSRPGVILYRSMCASSEQIDFAIQVASKAQEAWGNNTFEQRSLLLAEVAKRIRNARADLIGVMIADTGKTIPEADVEVSEAIDFAEYYRRTVEELELFEDLKWKPKGVTLVASPWNFPCSIPAGGILASLAAGNCVLFKPAMESIWVGWELIKLFWEAGISKEVLQFVPCFDEPTASQIVKDPRVKCVLLTGATTTAKHLLKLRPGLDLAAETGGKNAMIITRMSDRDLAIKDLVQSAFGHAGQKCSACSLAICEAEVYDDPHFRQQLKDAAASLHVGTAWNPATRMNPLIQNPNAALLRGLTQLDEDEEWLLKPMPVADHPNLWSPGIKLGVKAGSFTYKTELFGPVLGLMRADNLQHAIDLANGSSYGLTAGIHSLDEREQQQWLDQIEAGNCYVNRGITGAIVRRQPFGGCKDSSFGHGAKAGGPNYVLQLMHAEQIGMPQHLEDSHQFPQWLQQLTARLKQDKVLISGDLFDNSIRSYLFFQKRYFNKAHDPSKVRGEANLFRYVPHKQLLFRIQPTDSKRDILRVCIGAALCGTPLELSGTTIQIDRLPKYWMEFIPKMRIVAESEAELLERLSKDGIRRIRFLSAPNTAMQTFLANAACNVAVAPVLANGRIELLHYLREVSQSIVYHRYGNLGLREELPVQARGPCAGCSCCKCQGACDR